MADDRKQVDLILNTEVKGGENVDQTVDKVKTLKQQIKEAKLEVEKFEEGSEGFKKASQNVALLSDKLDDVNDQVKLLKGDALERVASGFKGVGSAILDLDVGKLKLANESLRSIKFSDLKQNVKEFGVQLTALATNPFFLIPAAIGLIISNFDTLKRNIPAIGAIIDGLTSAMNAFLGKSGQAYEESKKFGEQQKQNAEYVNEEAKAVSKESGEFIGLIFQLKSTNSQSKERADLIEKINSKYGTTIKNLKDEKQFQSELNGEVARYLEIQKAKFILQKNQEAINVQLEKLYKAEQQRARIENIFRLEGREGESLGDFVKRRSEYGKALSEASIQIGEANTALENLGAKALEVGAKVPEKVEPVKVEKVDTKKAFGDIEKFRQEVRQSEEVFFTESQKIEADREEKKAKAKKDYQELSLKDQQSTSMEYLSLLTNIELEATQKLNKLKDDEAAKQKLKDDERIAKQKLALDEFNQTLVKSFTDRQTEEDRIQNEGNNRRFELETQFNALSAEDKILKKQQFDNELLAIDADTNKKLEEQQKESAEKQAQIEKDLNDKKVQGVKNGLSTISNLAELFAGKSKKSQERAFKIQKGVAIAQATIDTSQAAVAAYKSLAGIPVVGPVLGGLAAAAAVAAGLVQIKKIKEQKFEGGGPEPGPGPAPGPDTTGAGPSAVQGGNQAPVGLPTFNLGGQQIGGAGSLLGLNNQTQNNQPVRVFVTESDISNVQGKVQVIQGNSLFGGGG